MCRGVPRPGGDRDGGALATTGEKALTEAVAAAADAAVLQQASCTKIFREMWCKYGSEYLRDIVFQRDIEAGREEAVISLGPQLSGGRNLFQTVSSVVRPGPLPEAASDTHAVDFNFQTEWGGPLADDVNHESDLGVYFFGNVRHNPSSMHVPHMAPKITDGGALAVAMLPLLELDRSRNLVRVAVERGHGSSGSSALGGVIYLRCHSLRCGSPLGLHGNRKPLQIDFAQLCWHTVLCVFPFFVCPAMGCWWPAFSPFCQGVVSSFSSLGEVRKYARVGCRHSGVRNMWDTSRCDQALPAARPTSCRHRL